MCYSPGPVTLPRWLLPIARSRPPRAAALDAAQPLGARPRHRRHVAGRPQLRLAARHALLHRLPLGDEPVRAGAGGPSRASRRGGAAALRLVINYFHKNFYQQLLFFLLPVYYASATRLVARTCCSSSFLAVSALVSTLDVFYDRHLSVRRGLLAVFFAFNLFACINVMLPTLWSISNRVALPLSAGLAVRGVRHDPVPAARTWRRSRCGGTSALPPSRWSCSSALGPAADPARAAQGAARRVRHAASTADAAGRRRRPTALPAGWSGRLYAVTAIYAPLACGIASRTAGTRTAG